MPTGNRLQIRLYAADILMIRLMIRLFATVKEKKLNWSLNPIPTIHTANALKRPSTLKNPLELQKPPKIRVYQEDQSSSFNKKDAIKDFSDLSEKNCPPSYLCYKPITSFITTSFLITNFQL